MSLADKHLHPLLVQRHDAARRARRSAARSSSSGAPRRAARCCARRSSRRSPAGAPATSSSPARRRRGCSARSRRRAARRRRSASSTSARPAAGRRRRKAATPKIAALLALAATARARPGAARRLRSDGPAADRRARSTPRCTGPSALSAQLAVTVLARPDARRGAELPAERDVPGLLRARSPRSPAGSARSTSRGRRRTRSTSTCARAATRASRVVSRAGDRLELPDRPRPLQATSQVRRRVRRDRRDRLRARTIARARALRPRPRPAAARRGSRMHQPPQGYFAPGADPLAQAQGGRRARDADRRVREAEVLRLQGVDLRAQPLAARPAARSASTSARRAAIRADGDHVAVEPHLCMGCGACATVCPSGAMTLRLSRPCPTSARGCGRCSRPTRRRAAATRACCSTPRTAATRSRGSRAAARGLPARVIPLEVHHVASVGLDVWLAALAWGASQVAVLATGTEAPQYREALGVPDGARRHDRPGARLPGRALPRRRRRRPTRSTRRCGRGRRRWRSRVPATFARDRRQAHDARRWRSSISPRTRRCRSGVIPLPAGRAVRRASTSTATPARCASPASARAPRARSSTTPEAPQLRFIETKCVQCGICADDLPRARDHARAAARPRRRRRKAAARAQRGGDRQLHRAAASRSAPQKMIDGDAGQARRPFDVRGARRARPAQDVRRLPRRST